ncbi:MAG: PTS fructose transporter subunit IIA [Desulfamplus sp.]|nr:PTS fructose transporter subunit IIA [Desulfamplus sp.]
MTGILIITHANLGQALIEAAELISDEKIQNVSYISIDIKDPPEVLRNKIKKGIKRVQGDKGVIIFTDMFGGTPYNLSCSFLEEGFVEVISSINLPMLIKAISIREKMDIKKAVEHIVMEGKKSIAPASGILRGEKRE